MKPRRCPFCDGWDTAKAAWGGPHGYSNVCAKCGLPMKLWPRMRRLEEFAEKLSKNIEGEFAWIGIEARKALGRPRKGEVRKPQVRCKKCRHSRSLHNGADLAKTGLLRTICLSQGCPCMKWAKPIVKDRP